MFSEIGIHYTEVVISNNFLLCVLKISIVLRVNQMELS